MEHQLKTDKTPPFIVNRASAGDVIYPPGGRLGPRVQQHVQLVFLHTGSMDIIIDGASYTVEPGNVVLLQPGHIEEFKFAYDQQTWHQWIDINIEPNTIQPGIDFHNRSFQIPISSNMTRIIETMLSLKHSTSPQQISILKSLGMAAVLLYISECSRHSYSGQIHPAIQIVKAVIEQHYAEELNLNMLSSRAAVSRDHLIRLFRRHEHTTPSQYLWKYRVNKAVELLCNTGLSIQEISYRTGFKTSYHFSRLIKRQTGHTPTEIRKNKWNTAPAT